MSTLTAPRLLALCLLVLTACSKPTPGTTKPARTPAKNFPSHQRACQPGPPTTGPACRHDSDCGLCHDGSPCGTVKLAAEVLAAGKACQQPDAADCECFSVHCCRGRCGETGYCPQPGDGYQLVGQPR